MEGVALFAKGLAVGLAIAIPVGPIGVLCVRRTLLLGRLAGLVSGLGAAAADAVYGGIIAFGLSLIADWLIEREAVFRLIGGIFLLALGARMFLHKVVPAELADAGAAAATDLPHAFVTTFLLTLSNPMTIVGFVGVFAAIGVGGIAESRLSAGLLVSGVFLGSALWWLVLAVAAGFLRDRLNVEGLALANRIAGGIMVLLGVYGVLSAGWVWF